MPDETFFEKTGKHDGECQRKADDLKPYSSTDKALWSRKLLAIAASVEAKSEHPLAVVSTECAGIQSANSFNRRNSPTESIAKEGISARKL